MGNDSIGNGPCVNPRNGAFWVEAFRQNDGGPKWDEGDGCENEGGGGAGEEAHQVLVRGGTMEPPLQIRRQEAVHSLHVFGTQRLIKGSHSPNAFPLLRWPLRVCQFRNCDERLPKGWLLVQNKFRWEIMMELKRMCWGFVGLWVLYIVLLECVSTLCPTMSDILASTFGWHLVAFTSKYVWISILLSIK